MYSLKLEKMNSKKKPYCTIYLVFLNKKKQGSVDVYRRLGSTYYRAFIVTDTKILSAEYNTLQDAVSHVLWSNGMELELAEELARSTSS
jgi:hypothetical protein